MTDTPHLGLPYIDGAQAQKHVTHNEALRILDAAIQIAVSDRTRTVPPPAPLDGARYLVAPGAGDAWAGHALAIATWQDGAWAYLTPQPGWCVWSIADDGMLVFDGASWRAVGAPPLDQVPHLGISRAADADNLLSVGSNAALFAAIDRDAGGSGDIRLQVSRESAADTASVVFSDHYSGRAEFGLVGSGFKLKVSADGAAWTEAFTVDAQGGVALPCALALRGVIGPPLLAADAHDYAPAGLAAASVLQLAADAPRDLTGLAGGAEGRIVSLVNLGGYPLTLRDESAASQAAHRFTLGADLALAPKRGAILRYDGTAARWQAIAGGSPRPPTVQTFLSGSGTYVTPPGVSWLEVLAVGGGGGSAGSGTAAGNGTSGGDTTFGGSLIIAGGGGAPAAAGFSGGGGGGMASLGVGAEGFAVGGGGGNPSNSLGAGVYPFGGNGGASLLGGSGAGGSASSSGLPGAPNTGGGGGGPSANMGLVSGASGGGGGSVEAIIATPLSSYAYTVGQNGLGGASGTGGNAGAAGGSGILRIVAYYD